MSNDVMHLDYEGIGETCTVLDGQARIFIDEVYRLLYMVRDLLEQGMYLEQASPALQTAYSEFSNSLHAGGTNLMSFAQLFESLRVNYENADNAAMASTLSSLDGEGGHFEPETEKPLPDSATLPEYNPPQGDIGYDVEWDRDQGIITSINK
ncbi:hypothetical protein RM844_15390 [Streptomyces sp. DSM 44915]|uniref:Uncharacterized protein n=1 Tax=Streptomyces chisholmiae TaxID=3075540 RepID=A0ABU2JRQ7_9ACTN|nr:hypothetical protein [Streptomyces sp. DSM 44915]MDT0267670.1 hypothetical protein [Streptomyces sp. DSM 44915]